GPAAAAGDHEQPPLGGYRRVGREEGHRNPDDVAADQVGGQRARRDRGEVCIQRQAEPPAQQRAQACPEADRSNQLPHRPLLVPYRLSGAQRFEYAHAPRECARRGRGETPTATFQAAEDRQYWVAQMRDIPRYCRERRQGRRAGMRRGFTPPRVTMAGRDTSITAGTDATPEASLFYTPVRDMPGIPAA